MHTSLLSSYASKIKVLFKYQYLEIKITYAIKIFKITSPTENKDVWNSSISRRIVLTVSVNLFALVNQTNSNNIKILTIDNRVANTAQKVICSSTMLEQTNLISDLFNIHLNKYEK